MSSTSARPQHYTFNDESVLGTSLELKIGAGSLPEAETAEAAALNEISREAKILSAWDHDSEFSRWARTSGQPVHVSRELFEVLGLFDQWRDRTGGALDASAEVITRLWKAGEQQQRLPSPGELAAVVKLVRQTHWRLDPEAQTAVHLSNAALVLSSFTKSYIVGHAADAALASGAVSSVVVNIGGDLVVRGAWTEPVDIADPQADAENSPPLGRLTIHDRAVATSGNDRRGVEIGGRHYSHIVDPRTGMPCDEVISSTVVARDPVNAGATRAPAREQKWYAPTTIATVAFKVSQMYRVGGAKRWSGKFRLNFEITGPTAGAARQYHSAFGFRCTTGAPWVQFRRCPKHFVRGTLPSFASRIGSLPCPSWPCWSAGWKFSSLTRASIGVRPATCELLPYSHCRFQPPDPPSRPATATCFPTRMAGAAICISKLPGLQF